MGLFYKQIDDLNDRIERLEKTSAELLHDIKNMARHLKDNRINVVDTKFENHAKRLQWDQVLTSSINVGGNYYIFCKTSIEKYKKMIKEFEQEEQEIQKELTAGIRRALSD